MPDTMMDKVIEAIFDALPASTCDEIASKISKGKRFTVSTGTVNNALAHLRANCAEYGWTVPHVKRGIATNEGRFIALLVDRDGHYELDQNADALAHITDGAANTIQQTATMMQNECAALRIAATHTRSTNSRARLNDLADDFNYIARKAAAVIRELKAA